MTKRTMFLLLGMIVLPACGATLEQLQSRAAYDLDCPPQQLQVTEIDDRTRGVRGCGRQATYVETCGRVGNYGEKVDCTWVVNGEIKKGP